jgi:hypothetical protein
MTRALLADLLGAVTCVALFAALAHGSWLAAARLVPWCPEGGPARVSVRWSAAAVVAAWSMVALFWLLAPFGLFRLWVVLPAVVLAALLLHRSRPPGLAALARGDAGRLAGLTRSIGGSYAAWPLGALSAVAALRFVRGTAAPNLGWDSLTYHLYKAGRWVQLGDLAAQPAPDAWSYYEYFPVVGDVYWAWVMLPLRSDALVTAAGCVVWLALLLGVYATARELGAPERRAALAAGAIGALPSVLGYLSSGYVDNTVAALFALGSLFAIRAWRHGSVREAPLAAAAFGLMLGAKLTAAFFFVAGVALAVAGLLRGAAAARAKAMALLIGILVALAGYPAYHRAWVERGSPFHPFPISFGGVVLSEGLELSSVAAETIYGREGFGLASPMGFWRYFLWEPSWSGAFLGPGLGLVLVAVLAVPGLIAALRRPGLRTPALFLLACAVLTAAGFLSGNMEVFRTTLKVTTAGRYLTIGVVAAAMLGAAWAGRLGGALWSLAILPGVILAFPRGWAREEAVPDALVAVLLGVAFLGLVAAARWGRGRAGPVAAAVAASVVLVTALLVLQPLRRAHRYSLYAATVDMSPLFHMHPLHAAYSSAWPIWRALDDGVPRRIAVTAGWDGIGHNWYRYPLLGGRLQNRVLYVPVTRDGSIVDYWRRDEVGRRADLGPWLARLVVERVDVVVSLTPRDTIEDHWMRGLPDLFEPMLVVPGDLHAAYRFDADAAYAALTRGGGGSAEP